jgi:hypothetical protein
MDDSSVSLPMPSSNLRNALAQLEEAILAGQLTPENPEIRVHLLGKLASVVSELPQPPETSDMLADRIAQLLWYKSHASQLNADEVLKAISDPQVAIRMVGADLLSTVVTSPERWKNPEATAKLLIGIKQQMLIENSPALALQFSVILEKMPAAKSAGGTQIRPPRNPYIAGLPVRDANNFYDRDAVLNRIRDSFAGSVRRVIVHGGRRTGKTSLLYKLLEGHLGTDFLPVYLDMQSCSGEPVGKFLLVLAGAIRLAAKRSGEQPVPRIPAGDITCELLSKMLDSLLEKSVTGGVVLLLDEYEVLTEFFSDLITARQITGLFDKHPRLFGIFSGGRLESVRDADNLDRLLDTAIRIEITFLDEEDARRLITEPSVGMLIFEESAVSQLYLLCHGHPFYTQLLCQSIFDAKKGLGTVTAADVQTAVDRFVLNPTPHLILAWTNDLNLAQKLVAAVLADLVQKDLGTVEDILEYLRQDRFPIRLAASEVYSALSLLQRIDWLKKAAHTPGPSFRESVKFEFTMELLPRWIREYSPAWNLLEEQRETVLSQSASPGARLGAAGIDLLAIIVLTVGLFFLHSPLWLPLVLCAAYYTLTVIFCDATPGMRFATRSHLTVVSEVGQPLGFVRAGFLAVLMAIPSAMISASLWLALTRASRAWAIALLTGGLALDALHQIILRRDSEQHRGIFDRWSRAVVINKQQTKVQ